MRLDLYLVKMRLVVSRSKGVHLIKTGNVNVNEKVVLKPSYNVKEDDKVELLSNYYYVGRGGYKIENFLNGKLDCKGKSVLDIGCSVGGFSDYFLQQGALKIVAIDIGLDIIDESLLQRPRLKFSGSVDATNEESLKVCLGNEKFDIISIDISKKSLKEILPVVSKFLKTDGFIVALFKPQYEGGKGIIPEKKINELTNNFENWLNKYYLTMYKEFSKFKGGSKNKGCKEVFYLLKLKK